MDLQHRPILEFTLHVESHHTKNVNTDITNTINNLL